MSEIKNLLIIGCGNMGGAMLAGWLAAGVEPTRFEILDPALEAAPQGVTLHREAPSALGHDAVLLGFKPQQLDAIGPQLETLTGTGVTIYSLLAGVELATLRQTFPNADARLDFVLRIAHDGFQLRVLFEEGLQQPV